MYNAVKIEKGHGGWGGPLVIQPTEKRNKIVSITGGGIDPLTRKIAKITGAQAIDGFSNGVADDEMACVVINCGGTLRCGVYPKKGVMTVNITPVGQSGPLAEFIKEDIYVSGVVETSIIPADASAVPVERDTSVIEEAPVIEETEAPK
ncbi:MAG: PTS sorbitol transporter subunit IIB, partial [Eubacterium sp.]